MNKKKVLGAVCALACATNFAFIQPVSARIMNAQEQEAWARHEEKAAFGARGSRTYSEGAIQATPIVQGIQRRLCDKNGIEVTTDLFQNTYDFETKVHPIQVIDDYYNASAMGAGYIYVGIEYLRSIKEVTKFYNQYDYISCEQVLAHELSHAIGGHTTTSKINKTKKEELAEKGAVKLMNNLPEGGWGAYLIGVYNDLNRPEINEQVKDSFVKESGGKITMPSFSTTVYHSKKGGQYELRLEVAARGRNMDSAYFGGQMADCIAHNALTVESLDVIPVPAELKESIKFKGDYILVCRSSKFPSGYRILAPLYYFLEPRDKVMNEWNRMKSLVLKGDGDIEWYNNMEKLTIKRGDSSKDNMWRMWLALAVAKDVQNR